MSRPSFTPGSTITLLLLADKHYDNPFHDSIISLPSICTPKPSQNLLFPNGAADIHAPHNAPLPLLRNYHSS